MKTPHRIKLLTLTMSGALSLSLGHLALAQDGQGPAYRPSQHPGVNVRSVPAPQAAAQARAVAPRRNTGIVQRNRRNVRLRNGRTVTVSDIDPESLPHQVATVGRDGKLALQCLDPAHKHLSSAAHSAKHGGAKSAAKGTARKASASTTKSQKLQKSQKRAGR